MKTNVLLSIAVLLFFSGCATMKKGMQYCECKIEPRWVSDKVNCANVCGDESRVSNKWLYGRKAGKLADKIENIRSAEALAQEAIDEALLNVGGK